MTRCCGKSTRRRKGRSRSTSEQTSSSSSSPPSSDRVASSDVSLSMCIVRTCSTKFGISFRSFDCIKDLDCRHRGERSTWFHPPLPIRRRDETGENSYSWPSPSLILYKHTIHHHDLMLVPAYVIKIEPSFTIGGRHRSLGWTSQSNRESASQAVAVERVSREMP